MSAIASLSGCLFPSFEGMGDDPGAKGDAFTEHRDLAAAAEVKAGAVGQASTVGAVGDASAAPSAPQSAAPPPVVRERMLACGSASCRASRSYCCAEPSAPSCRANEEAPAGCLGALHCTSRLDCNGGEVCCGNPSSNEASCRAQCDATIVEAGPQSAGYQSGVWTGPMIGDLIEARFSVRYHNHHVPRLLHQLGFSVQRPRKRLARADAEAQEYWLRVRFPAIKKKRAPVAAS
jgi:hypothetical protein